MIYHDVAQGSENWHRLRLGIPTASCFDQILTKTGKPSAQAERYRCQLVAERHMGIPIETYQSEWMERGQDLEEEAWRFYEMLRDVEVHRGGFCTTDDVLYGCSPDGLIYDVDTVVGGLELKCPKPETHTMYLLDGADVVQRYKHQVQGCMLVTGAKWWDIMSYHPMFPPALVRVERSRDGEYMAALADALEDFSRSVAEAHARLEEMAA